MFSVLFFNHQRKKAGLNVIFANIPDLSNLKKKKKNIHKLDLVVSSIVVKRVMINLRV